MTTHRYGPQKQVSSGPPKETVRQQAKRLNTSISKVRKLRQGTIKYSEVNS